MAGRYNMVCDQGSTFSLVFTIKTDGVAWDLVGNYTARMSVKTSYLVTQPAISLTTANGRIAFVNNPKCKHQSFSNIVYVYGYYLNKFY